MDGSLVALRRRARAGTHVRGNPAPIKSYRPIAEKARRDGFTSCRTGTRGFTAGGGLTHNPPLPFRRPSQSIFALHGALGDIFAGSARSVPLCR